VGSALKAMSGTLDPKRVRVSLPEDLPLVNIDAVLIERVLCNLLENAAKYTPPGSQIEIGAGTSSERVIVTVDDHGPGLPKGREEAIFQKFERGRKESATSGVGLGLAICTAIVQAHGGTIRGETRPKGGARFTFELPRGVPPSMDDAEDVDEAAGKSHG
jgi:two-component system sensor histidine kinase KdpD